MLFEPYGIVLGAGNAICCMWLIDLYSFPRERVNGFLSARETDRWKKKEQMMRQCGGACMCPDSCSPLCDIIIFLV